MLNFLFSPDQMQGAGDVTSDAIGYSSEISGVSMAVCFIFLVIEFFALMRLYRKIGVSPWIILVPIYNFYVFFKAFGVRRWFWILVGLYTAICGVAIFATLYMDLFPIFFLLLYIMFFAFLLVAVVGMLYYEYNMARAFGKGFGFFVGLLLFPMIFYWILAFGKSEYVGVPK